METIIKNRKSAFITRLDHKLYHKIIVGIVILCAFLVIYKFVVPSSLQKELKADLDNNGRFETYILANGKLTVSEVSRHVWQTPAAWHVDDFILADSTNDGVIDINLSVWKAGSFGENKPFWVKENDARVRNHFFVFNYKNQKVNPVWQSSNLTFPNQEIAVGDVDRDKKNELVVIEGDYSHNNFCKNNYIAVWRWREWGFFNEWRSEKGNYCHLKIETENGKSFITVNSKRIVFP